MAKVFIGMPVFNGEKFIYRAIESITLQTYQDWELLISDNYSTDRTQEICEDFLKKDKRIKYIRQEKNIGVDRNFTFLFNKADSQYFMWAAADDVWYPQFIELLLARLENNTKAGLAFSNIEVINEHDELIRLIPSFTRLISTDPNVRAINFLAFPEIMGKANLMYGLYDLRKVKPFISAFLAENSFNSHGADVVLVFGIISRFELEIVEEVLFMKRQIHGVEKGTMRVVSEVIQPNVFSIPPTIEAIHKYFDALIRVAKSNDEIDRTTILKFIELKMSLYADFRAYLSAVQSRYEANITSLENSRLRKLIKFFGLRK